MQVPSDHIETQTVLAMAALTGLELSADRADAVSEHLRRIAAAAGDLEQAELTSEEQAHIAWCI